MAFGPDIDYALVEAGGRRLVLAESLVEKTMATAGIGAWKLIETFPGTALEGAIAAHPLRGLGDGYGFDVPLHAADFVSDEEGTGLVHIAPSHGADDFELGRRHGLEVPDTVAEDGVYTDAVPGFAGMHVFKAAEPVLEALKAKEALLAHGTLVHSYPHSWRSKAPLIFRATAAVVHPDGGRAGPAGDGARTPSMPPHSCRSAARPGCAR